MLIPYGYHSVSAPPRYDLYYLWAIAGDERKLAVYEDPAHRWVMAPLKRVPVASALRRKPQGRHDENA